MPMVSATVCRASDELCTHFALTKCIVNWDAAYLGGGKRKKMELNLVTQPQYPPPYIAGPGTKEGDDRNRRGEDPNSEK